MPLEGGVSGQYTRPVGSGQPPWAAGECNNESLDF